MVMANLGHTSYIRLARNHKYNIYTVYIRYFRQGKYQICDHKRCKDMVLANPDHTSHSYNTVHRIKNVSTRGGRRRPEKGVLLNVPSVWVPQLATCKLSTQT